MLLHSICFIVHLHHQLCSLVLVWQPHDHHISDEWCYFQLTSKQQWRRYLSRFTYCDHKIRKHRHYKNTYVKNHSIRYDMAAPHTQTGQSRSFCASPSCTQRQPSQHVHSISPQSMLMCMKVRQKIEGIVPVN